MKIPNNTNNGLKIFVAGALDESCADAMTVGSG